MNQFYQTSPDLSVSALSANCHLIRARYIPMKRRHFLWQLASMVSTTLTFASVGTARASSNDDEDDDHDDDHEDKHENRNEDENDEEKVSTTQDQAETSHDEDDEEEHHDDEDNDDHDGDHQQALEAVRANEAIPFRDILEIFEQQFGGKIIDASIYQKRGQLVYRFKYVDQSGYVLTAFYQAATGLYLGN